jgi:fibronectin type 3 domain-containing protein
MNGNESYYSFLCGFVEALDKATPEEVAEVQAQLNRSAESDSEAEGGGAE